MTPRESRVWSVFVKKSGFMATCTACHRDFSYRASVSNLSKHWKNKHGKPIDLSDSSSDISDVEQEKIDTNKKPSATWKFFEVADSDKFEATCKICDKVVSYDSVSDLRSHVEDHGELAKDSDDDYTLSAQQRRHVVKYAPGSRRHSKLWKYFKVVDDKMAICLVCHGMFNYASTITNLRRHLVRKHGKVDLTQDDDGNKMIVSANGQLYEVETGPSHEDNDDDKLPIEMDTIYLEDLEDPIDEPPSPKKKQPKLTLKRNISTEYLNQDHSKEQIKQDYSKDKSQKELSKNLFKRDFSKKSLKNDFSKEQFQKYFTKEQLKKNTDTCSEYSELNRPRTSLCSTTAMGSIDYFGQYIVSLLKELPKPVSDQLQNDIVNQILSSKIALHSKPMAAKYELTVSRNNEVMTEINVPEPVTFTVVQSNEDPEKTNDATVQE